jgi:prophage regulatory protein
MPKKKDRETKDAGAERLVSDNPASRGILADLQKKLAEAVESGRLKGGRFVVKAKAEESRQRHEDIKKAVSDFLVVERGGREYRYLRLPDVLKRFPVSQSAWYDGMKKGIYPRPTKLGPRTVAWLESDIDELVTKAKRDNLGRE